MRTPPIRFRPYDMAPKYTRSHAIGGGTEGLGHRLKEILYTPNFDVTRLKVNDPADRRLLCSDILERGDEARYVQMMPPFITGVHRSVYERSLAALPPGFLVGFQGRLNAQICLRDAFQNILGLVIDEASRKIDPRLFVDEQFNFLRMVVKHPEKKHWHQLFLELRLFSSLHLFEHSPAKMIEMSYPWMFDLNTPEGQHLHPWDFITRDEWVGKGRINLAVTAIRHTFEKHLGLIMDESSLTIDSRLKPLRKANVSDEATSLPRLFGKSHWMELWTAHGLGKMVAIVPEFNRKTCLAIRTAYPWAFNLATDEGKHLHSWEFVQTSLWSGEKGAELAGEALRHVLEKHLGLKMKPPTPEDPAFSIDERLIQGDAADFLSSAGDQDWLSFTNHHLLFLVEIRKDRPDFPRYIGRVFEWLYPWAFDLTTPEGQHLHFWRIGRPNWEKPKDIQTAVKHEVRREGWRTAQLPVKATRDWFKQAGLGGLLGKFESDRIKLLTRVYPKLSEADFTGLRTSEATSPMKSFRPYTAHILRLSMEGRVYCLPENFSRGKFAKKINDREIGIFERREKEFHLVATFPAIPNPSGKYFHIAEADIIPAT